MAEPPTTAEVPSAVDSHGAATKPRSSARTSPAGRDSQKALAVPPEAPLHVRPVLNYAEVAALGILPERSLRRLVATGSVKRSVMRLGRSVRFVKDLLIAELLAVGE
jgi:hypothetical protein